MATYVLLLSYTQQGIETIKDSPKRLEAAKKLAKRLDSEIKKFYLTLGAYDAVVLLDAPTDEAASKFALAAGALGNVRTTTMRAYTEAEFRDLVADLP
jgi:uncharacterized protein with GYD domain